MSSAPVQLEVPSFIEVGDEVYKTELLVPAEDVQAAVTAKGNELADHYAQLGDLHVLTILNGAIHYGSDTRRTIQAAQPELRVTSDQMRVSSYKGVGPVGKINIRQFPTLDITGRHVLVAEDVIDSGETLLSIINYLSDMNPASIEVAAAVKKDVAQRPKDFLGSLAVHSALQLPDDFIIGYGLDLDEQYRDLSSIYVLKPVDAKA